VANPSNAARNLWIRQVTGYTGAFGAGRFQAWKAKNTTFASSNFVSAFSAISALQKSTPVAKPVVNIPLAAPVQIAKPVVNIPLAAPVQLAKPVVIAPLTANTSQSNAKIAVAIIGLLAMAFLINKKAG